MLTKVQDARAVGLRVEYWQMMDVTQPLMGALTCAIVFSAEKDFLIFSLINTHHVERKRWTCRIQGISVILPQHPHDGIWGGLGHYPTKARITQTLET